MKKLNDLKIGILIGLIASCAVLAYEPITEHYASAVSTGAVKNFTVDASNFFTSLIDAVGGTNGRLGYDDVFGSVTYKNLYVLLYQKALVDPENDALKTIASSYGFTVSEAQSVLDGSIEPLITKYGGDAKKNQRDLYSVATQFREDFIEAYDMVALEQELTIGGVASEIFSNGEVTDSGFDLVNDLTIIEETIFGTNTKSSLGGPLEFGSTKNKEEDTDELIATGNADSTPAIPSTYSDDVLKKVDESSPDEGSPESFDPTSLVQIQENDLCPKPETKIEGALNDYKEINPSNIGAITPEEPEKEAKPTISNAAAEIAAKNPDSLLGTLIPEIPADWADNPECNGFFYALANGTDEKKSDTEAGNAENTEELPTAQISAEFFVCLEATTKWAKYGTVVADKPCIKCETEKILAYLNKTLENSFIPNKVTGNFMEPSKCKSAFTSLLDIKFNLIWNPVQTPRKDDSNKLKSLGKEWGKFISRSNPLVLDEIPMTFLGDSLNNTSLSTAQENVSASASYAELMDQVAVVKNTFAKEASEGTALFPIISSGENFVTYSQDVMKEVDQMTNYFLNFNTIFTTAEGTCREILKKPTIK